MAKRWPEHGSQLGGNSCYIRLFKNNTKSCVLSGWDGNAEKQQHGPPAKNKYLHTWVGP